MTLTKKKGVYYAKVKTTKGTTKHITTGSRDKREAARIVEESGIEQLERSAQAGRLSKEAIGQISTGRKLTLVKALQHYCEWMKSVGRSNKTMDNNAWVIESWVKFANIGSFPPSAVTEQHVNEFVNNEESEAGAATRQAILSSIRSFFDFTAAKGWSSGNPARLVIVNLRNLSHEQKEPRKVLPFTNTEIKRLLKETEERGDIFWNAAIRLSRETGLRLGDVCALEWDCFNYAGKVVVWTKKRGKRVAVPISEELSELITTIPVTHQQYIFPVERMIVTDPKRRCSLSVYFMRLCQKCEIEGKSFHSLRHSFITELARQGKTLEDIGVLVGHSETKTTEGYVHKERE